MTGTQLRIGNILRLKSNHALCKVCGVDGAFSVYIELGDSAMRLDPQRLEGVPLTNPILKACGFNEDRILKIPGEPAALIIGTNKNGGVVAGVVTMQTEFKFLHQLQNLFFGLTGKELQIGKL